MRADLFDLRLVKGIQNFPVLAIVTLPSLPRNCRIKRLDKERDRDPSSDWIRSAIANPEIENPQPTKLSVMPSTPGLLRKDV